VPSLFVQITVSPGEIVIELGENERLMMLTE